jgi:hypothetical protein
MLIIYISLWVIKKTLYGTYCLTKYIFVKPEIMKEEIILREIKNEIKELDYKIDFYNKIKDKDSLNEESDTDFEIIN